MKAVVSTLANSFAVFLGMAVAVGPGASTPAAAHEMSESYLDLRIDGSALHVRLDVALRDLHHALDLDRDRDGAIVWGELRARHSEIAGLVREGVRVLAGERECVHGPHDHLVAERGGAGHAVVRFVADCGQARPDAVAFRLLAAADPSHRALVRLDSGTGVTSALLGAGRTRLALGDGAQPWTRVAADYLREGTRHVLAGADHLVFVATLLLPVVLLGVGGREPRDDGLRPVVLEVLAVVTAFTVAHGITLGAATLWSLSLPARPVESAIAATIVLAAFANLLPTPPRRRWTLAFVLGLVHGLGFAGALAELGLPASDLVLALAAFNLGIEAGQLAVVAALVPVLLALRARAANPALLVRIGSAAVAVVGSAWLVERSVDVGAWLT